jgi:Gpi18-like mannosyltransferase
MGRVGASGRRNFGDNSAYLELANAIRHWRFVGITAHQFWGVSYATAALSLTGLSLQASLVIVCLVSSLVGVVFCYRLWDGWVAAFFALLSFDCFQRSLLGGSESLFIALVLLAFWLVRRERWKLAALLGALATVVRPYGFFVLMGLGIQLLWQKKFKEFSYATAIALLVGAAYTWPNGALSG